MQEKIIIIIDFGCHRKKGFIDVFDEKAHKVKDVKWLAQGMQEPPQRRWIARKNESETLRASWSAVLG